MGQKIAALTVAGALLSGSSIAGEQAENPSQPRRLGKTHFVTSCHPSIERRFDGAVAMLHSFWFSEAIKGFNRVLEADPGCTMAYWGIAMSNWGFRRQIAALRAGSAAIDKAQAQSSAVKTQREKDYIGALALLYKDFEHVNPRTRILAYEKAMEELTLKYPEDREAPLFYALAILDTVVPTDKTHAARLKAAAILEKEFAAEPDHAGTAHYIIHAYDVPALAPRALNAALRYAKLAPDVAHPLHMPSHVFTRLGYWEESIDSNTRSAAAAMKEGAAGAGERLHALDYAVYAYLQTAQDRAASRIVQSVPAIARGSGPKQFGSANFFAVAAIPARHALERHAWAEAAKLEPHPSEMPYADAMTHFARALGFARTAQPALARTEIDRLAALRDKLTNAKDLYWAEQVEIERLAATAWTSFAEGRRVEALNLMETAADQEDSTEKAGTTPGPLMPARELLADMLLESNNPAQALREYEATMMTEPNRFRAVHGAARAAELAGNRTKSKQYYAQLLQICARADEPGRPELAAARRIVSDASASR